MLLYFEDQAAPARAIADAAGMPSKPVQRHRFPDGEVRITLPAALPQHVVIYRSLDHPNEKLVELLLAARTARALGAQHLTLVAPYLAYMRQDMEFHPGEAVSQGIVGRFLAGLFDAAITVDPHLHRVATLQEAMPLRQAKVLCGADSLSDWVVLRHKDAILVGPDAESEQWVARAAARHGLQYMVCSKVRSGDHDVAITLGTGVVKGRATVIMDDVASTGQTVAAAARLLRSADAASIDAAVTHALFAPDALARIHSAGVAQVWTTDCIVHPTNAVAMALPLAHALAEILATAQS